MIVGVGVDLVAITRIEQALARRRAAFLRRVFTIGEQQACQLRKQQAACYAARFAGKEATMKALGCGWGPIGWQDVEICRGLAGQPIVVLHDRALRWAAARGIKIVHLSLSHEQHYALAYAVAWGNG